MKIFGYSIDWKTKEKARELTSHVIDDRGDGSATETSPYSSGRMSYGYNSQVSFENEAQLITKYRSLSQNSEVDSAIDDIINEAICHNEDGTLVEIDLSQTTFPDNVKSQIQKEFDQLLSLMNFTEDSYELFRRWYVDGRIYFEKSIDEKSPQKGIQQIKYIDPRKIRKIVESDGTPISMYGKIRKKNFKEYYLYNPYGLTGSQDGLMISPDCISHSNSGVYDEYNRYVVSHLHKAIKPFNNLRMLEDSLVIYRLARAPERRIFNVEVGTLNRSKTEEYMSELMRRFKRKTNYDPNTGEMQDSRYFMTMLEDFWFPKRDGKGTTVDTMASGQNLGEIEDVNYFKQKLYQSLNVPITRIDSSQSQFNLGRSSEISRDELKFGKFISRLRRRFSKIFYDILRDHLILKRIITEKEWETQKSLINFDFVQDNHFVELKRAEIHRERMNSLRETSEFIGVYYTKKWIQKNILSMSDQDIQELELEMEEERKKNKELGVDDDNFEET